MDASFLRDNLTPREAVADALHRCVLGIDSNNHDLFESACLTNEEMTWIGNGINIEGWTAIKELFERLFVLVTTHTISNIQVELKSAQSAILNAHAMSYHVRPEDAFKPEDTSYTASSLYQLELVKDVGDGLWKIKKWEAKVLWTTGDRAFFKSVMARTKQSAHQPLNDDATASTISPRPQQILESTEKKVVYTCSCGNEAATCCVKRCTEPLAWNIKEGEVVTQENCPLFTTIPKELRDLIYKYALTESTFNHPGQVAPDRYYRRNGESLRYDYAKNLLLTCKAVYLETSLLPVLLNPVQLPFFDGWDRYAPKALLPWQFANIQSLDITLQQVALEGNSLYNFIHGATCWRPDKRHEGVYVTSYVGLKNTTGGSCRSCDFTLLPATGNDDRVHLGDALESMRLPSRFKMPMSNTRLQRARPLVHLTLRLPSRNWWTWTDDPTSTDARQHHLGLEPALGDGSANLASRPTCTRMQELAQQRRDGQQPVFESSRPTTIPGWAHTVSELPDIKSLELVLETFEEKTAQLENVVNCAKAWRFPIEGTQFELTWNGKVEHIHWSKPLIENYETRSGEWYARSTEFEVRIIRFTRRRAA
ncbi:hypothetical protein OPT61_g4566 [Boeremia exigua]|uniref:Uncharacterized protein n=1 Tax=Boeremia exigua TaxID=749465 RepID=A0ACC2IDK5_9PLEO|nr:hypothetical protein OPT61_g4566 [Boeremia exigua]